MKIVVSGLILFFIFIFYRLFKVENEMSKRIANRKKGIVAGNKKPDMPLNFPQQSLWLSVRANDPQKVASAMGLKSINKTNWESGLTLAYENDCIFITPQVDGWVLVTGLDLPIGNTRQSFVKLKRLLKNMSKVFGEAYFFTGFMDYYCWAKSADGNIERLYAYDGNSDGYFSIGEPIGAERWYRLVDKTPDEIPEEDQEYWTREEITFPDHELLYKIAADWNINPTKLKERHNLPGLGLIGILNSEDN